MSCSYGPGRYDPTYEELGRDYPPGYVRWTENRNMQAFQQLIHNGRINLDFLTTHEFQLFDAERAYDLIVDRHEPFLGVVLKYDVSRTIPSAQVRTKAVAPDGRIGVGFIGAGSYAQGSILPNLPRHDADIAYHTVLARSGTSSKRVAERFGFASCSSQESDIFAADDINTVFITTRHDSHAQYVLKSLASKKHVFVEKPLCLEPDELTEIEDIYCCVTNQQRHLMVGFNRRFAPHAVALKRVLHPVPMSMIYRINAGRLPADHWVHDPALGGGRIVGECCHFIDFFTWLTDSLPAEVYAIALPDADAHHDTVTISLRFENGSTGVVCYFANGSRQMAKEYVEVHQSGITATIHDFKRLEVHGKKKKPITQRSLTQDKGQSSMLRAFLGRIKDGGPPLIPPEHLFGVTRVCFAILQSLRTRQPVNLGDSLEESACNAPLPQNIAAEDH